MGVLFTLKGLNKDKYQIALESAPRWDYNEDTIINMINSKHETELGIILIGLSFLLQIIILSP